MEIKWNEQKDLFLQESRNICFEDIAKEIDAHRNTEPIVNPAHENQFITFVKLNDYPVAVP